MPAYEYYCDGCNRRFEIVATMRDVKTYQLCTKCGAGAKRIFTAPQINTTVSNYSAAHGIDLANKAAVNDMKKRYHDKTGSNLVEVGNEDLKKHIKRPEYTYETETKAAIQARG